MTPGSELEISVGRRIGYTIPMRRGCSIPAAAMEWVPIGDISGDDMSWHILSSSLYLGQDVASSTASTRTRAGVLTPGSELEISAERRMGYTIPMRRGCSILAAVMEWTPVCDISEDDIAVEER